jgi:hypothetical protein
MPVVDVPARTKEPDWRRLLFLILMSDPEYQPDFSARRGCVWAPLLFVALLVLIAAITLFAQHRVPVQTSPPVPAKTAPALTPSQPKGG